MIDYEFRVFSPKLIDQSITLTNWVLAKNLLIKRNSIENHIKIFKKNKINKIFICSIPFEKKKIFIQIIIFFLIIKKVSKLTKN